MSDLLERLNYGKFILQLQKIKQIVQNKQEDEVLKIYFNQNKDIIEKSHEVVNCGRVDGFYLPYIRILAVIYECFFFFKFKELLLPQKKYKNFVSL